jgi:hypothetical protein
MTINDLLPWPDIQLATLDDPADLDEATLDETGGVIWRAKDPKTSGLEEMEDNLLRVYHLVDSGNDHTLRHLLKTKGNK